MKKIVFAISLAAIAFAGCKDGASTGVKGGNNNFKSVNVNTDSESEKFSYSIGMIVGNTLKNNNIDSIDYDIINRAFKDSENDQMAYMMVAREVQSLAGEELDLASVDQSIMKRAIYDVLQGDTTLISMPEVNKAYTGFLENNQTKVGERNLEAGKTFLEANKAKEGVKTTDSGLQYQLIEEGSGEKFSTNDVVLVDLVGTNANGDEFVNTQDGGQKLPVILNPKYGNVSGLEIPGLIEGINLFPAGSIYKLYIPSNLAFGPQRLSPEIGPNSTIVLEVKGVEKMPADQQKQYLQQVERQMEQQRMMMQQMQRQQGNQ